MFAPSEHRALHRDFPPVSRLTCERVDDRRNCHCVPAGVSELGTIVSGELLCQRLGLF
jgi:hypothetical protein